MRNYLFMAAAILLGGTALAQQNTGGEMTINKLILPNGKELPTSKLDSIRRAWGDDRVIFRHSDEDDEKGIVHLVRRTDEQIAQGEADANALNAMVGQAAPQFELTDIHGKKWSLKALRGKVVVLNFWFTACPPCIREMPELNKLADQYKGNDVVFLALAPDNAAKVNTFLKKHEFRYTILPDSQQVDKRYKIASWPTSMVIDKKGIIRFVQVTGDDITARIKAAIAKAQ